MCIRLSSKYAYGNSLFRFPKDYWQKQPPGGVLKIKLLWKLSQNSHEDTCAQVSFNDIVDFWPATLFKKIPAQMVSYEFSEIF